jgi:hypothetical protein
VCNLNSTTMHVDIMHVDDMTAANHNDVVFVLQYTPLGPRSVYIPLTGEIDRGFTTGSSSNAFKSSICSHGTSQIAEVAVITFPSSPCGLSCSLG